MFASSKAEFYYSKNKPILFHTPKEKCQLFSCYKVHCTAYLQNRHNFLSILGEQRLKRCECETQVASEKVKRKFCCLVNSQSKIEEEHV